MKPTYEKIEVAVNTSLKVGVYGVKTNCLKVNWHIHPEYEIVYIKNGSGTVQIDKYISNYENGILLFLGPNTPHMPFGNDDFENRMEVVIQFGEDFIINKLRLFPEFSSILKLISLSKKGIIFHSSIKNKTADLFEKLKSSSSTEKLLNVFQILHILSQASEFKTIKKNDFNLNYKTKDIQRINYAFEYVNNSFHKEIATRIIAKKVGLTTNSFCRLFKKTTHKTFTQFINEFRIRKATELLDQGEFSISEVMYKCGYNDPSYFSKQFKRYKGVSPSVYLKTPF